MRQTLVAGNWKMNGSRETIKSLLDDIKAGIADVTKADMAVCCPAVYIADVSSQLQGSTIGFGGQDISVHTAGAYTGEIAGSMWNDFNCKYVIIGHSERRTYHGENDELVAEKFEAALNAGLIPLFCIGETLEERESGITLDVVSRQVKAVIDRLGVEKLGQGVIAYEPVWAIGTGVTATPEQAQETHANIRQMIAESDAAVAEKIQILYGGSMNAGNAEQLLACEDIDGGLIGGASLKADDFLAIGRAAG